MPVDVRFEVDSRQLNALDDRRLSRAIGRAVAKAGSTALRDMRSEATKRIRQRKRLKAGIVGKSFRLRRPKGTSIDGLEFGLDVSGKPVSLLAYPHRRTKRGVSVEVNRGKRTNIRGAFIATMKSGHDGIFVRRGKRRLPIRELFGSRPVDALLHKGEAEGVQERGASSMRAAFDRLLPLELEKLKASGS